MKFKLFLAQILDFIAGLWKKTTNEVKKITPISVNAVNVLKSVNDSFIGDIVETVIASIIPGKADDVFIKMLRERLRVILPKVILQLSIVDSIANTENINEQLKAIVLAINMSPNETKNIYYHSLCVLILEGLADGKLTFSESVQISEYYYTNIYKK